MNNRCKQARLKSLKMKPNSFFIRKPDYELNKEDCLKTEIIGNIKESKIELEKHIETLKMCLRGITTTNGKSDLPNVKQSISFAIGVLDRLKEEDFTKAIKFIISKEGVGDEDKLSQAILNVLTEGKE